MAARQTTSRGGCADRTLLGSIARDASWDFSVRIDWRRALIYTHRWLGITGSLVFFVWFASGVVMMYQRMPRLTAEERLVRLPRLDLSAIRITPAAASRLANVTPNVSA